MRNFLKLLVFTVVFSACNNEVDKPKTNLNSNTKFTNLFIGTGGHGHTYPGAQIPFGMVQLSPDNGRSGWDWVSGYHYSDSVIVGFSHTHLSGAGIGDLQDISIMPTSKHFDINTKFTERLDKPYADFYSHDREIAEPGYYQVYLENSRINVELSAAKRSGIHKYTFAENSEQFVVLDLSYAVNWDWPYSAGINVESSNTISGYRHSNGWAKDQKQFFVMEFSKDITDYEISKDSVASKSNTEEGQYLKLLAKFDEKQGHVLKVKVGLSAVSIENAKENLKHDFGSKWDFSEAVQNAQGQWGKALNDITVESTSEEIKTIFYTSLYHAYQAPTLYSDVNGDYRAADGSVKNAQGYNHYTGLSIWDIFRTQSPLLSITKPEVSDDLAKTFLAHFDETGTLPVWVLAGNEANTMTGYHSVSMLAELINKGSEAFDYEKAYQAMKATMMQDQRGLKELREYNYIPYELVNESVTIALEMAYNYYSTSQIAKKLGYEDDYKYFLELSMAYKRIFDDETQFMRGKDSKGKWRENFDPKHASHRVATDYTEGNAWQHSWFVLHDVEGLINEFGSEESFEKKLDQLFTESSEINGEHVSPDITGLIGQYAHGNEPSHHIAYMYNFIGKPWKTQEIVSKILNEQYSNQADGISGNEDMGQMSAWYVMSSIGLYPYNPTDGNLLIGTPLFDKTTINLKEGKTFIIESENLSDENIYIQSASLNGKPLNRSYLTYKELISGGTLEFKMGSEPNKEWASKKENYPPTKY